MSMNKRNQQASDSVLVCIAARRLEFACLSKFRLLTRHLNSDSGLNKLT